MFERAGGEMVRLTCLQEEEEEEEVNLRSEANLLLEILCLTKQNS